MVRSIPVSGRAKGFPGAKIQRLARWMAADLYAREVDALRGELSLSAASAELRDFPLVSATFCARVTGWFAWFAEKAEKTAKVSHPTCRAKGDAVCRWRIDW